MSSVWLTTSSNKTAPQKMAGNLCKREAMRYLRRKTVEYVAAARPGHQHEVKLCGDTVLLYCNDKLDGSLHVEHFSPPTKAGPGDNWVKKEAH